MKQLFPSASGGIELFDEFFESGREESISPFLFPRARKWGVHLHLKASAIAAFLLGFSFLCSFLPGQQALSNLFLLFSFFFAGIPALISAVEDLVNLEINIDVLMTLAAFLSVVIGSGKEGALLLVLFSFSGAMENGVRTKAKGTLIALKKLSPQKAFVVNEDGTFLERAIRDISVGTSIHVKSGQIVPLDGVVIDGASSVNLVHLTGESMPISCKIGDTVPAGGRNLEGALTLSVTHSSSDSTLARIIQLIIQAQEAKPKLQRWLDTVSKHYAICIILSAFLFALTLPFFSTMTYLGIEGSIYRSLAFLIAASPCALVIAVPIAYLSAISACAKQGILLKGGFILDSLAQCKTLAMDKTGTLTKGELTCQRMQVFGENLEALSLAYSLERSAMHPIADAIVAFGLANGAKLLDITDFLYVPGQGLQALYRGKKVCIGKASWIMQVAPEYFLPELKNAISKIENCGEPYTLLHYKSSITLFQFKDTLRPRITSVLKELKEKENFRLLMLTGDHYESAKAIAKEAGIDEFFAGLRPEDKLEHISKIENLAMIGDGMNDAPALARANVGIAMGKAGSSTAIDASDIVLLQDNIELLPWLIKKSHQVIRIVKQNVVLAACAIVFAAFSALLGWIPLWLAVVLHEGGTVLVGLNALRLLKRGKKYGKRRCKPLIG